MGSDTDPGVTRLMSYYLHKVSLFEVLENTDPNEGRGPKRTVGYAQTRELAEMNATGKGILGGPGEVREVEALVVLNRNDETQFFFPVSARIMPEDILDSIPEEAEKAKELALAKLSPHERKLLGLT